MIFFFFLNGHKWIFKKTFAVRITISKAGILSGYKLLMVISDYSNDYHPCTRDTQKVLGSFFSRVHSKACGGSQY
jgi:hypothetical protein